MGTLILKSRLSPNQMTVFYNRKWSYETLRNALQLLSTGVQRVTSQFDDKSLTPVPLAMLKAIGQALFSTGLQNPKFTPEEHEGQDYEIRTYLATKWVSTSLSGMELDPATGTGFRRLFNYIQGNNQNKVKVEMTAPVTCRVEPGAGPACESKFTISFYVPEEHQAAPPEPSDPEVFVEHRKEFTAYVRTYGGFSNETLKRTELLKLLESLQRDGVPYMDNPYYVVGYDSPFKLTNRRNEVWVLREEEQHQRGE